MRHSVNRPGKASVQVGKQMTGQCTRSATSRSVRSIVERRSPSTEITLAFEPMSGSLMNVAFSRMIRNKSAVRSLSIQSSFRGNIGTSRDMTSRACVRKRECQRCMRDGGAIMHTFKIDAWNKRSFARCTPKYSPVKKMKFCFDVTAGSLRSSVPDSGVGK